MYIVTETVGQTKVETPVATAYDGFLHLAKSVPTYKYQKVVGYWQLFTQAPLLWFLALNQGPQVLCLAKPSERFVVEGRMDELGHYHISLTKEYPSAGKPKRIVNTLTWRDDPVPT